MPWIFKLQLLELKAYSTKWRFSYFTLVLNHLVCLMLMNLKMTLNYSIFSGLDVGWLTHRPSTAWWRAKWGETQFPRLSNSKCISPNNKGNLHMIYTALKCAFFTVIVIFVLVESPLLRIWCMHWAIWTISWFLNKHMCSQNYPG